MPSGWPKDLTLAQRFAAVRQHLRLTQAELAERLGVTRVTLNRWENGHLMPSARAQRHLAELEARAADRASDSEQAAGTRPLPVPLTSFVGRPGELAATLAYLLDEGTRLLTLTGLGGAGKTRLALELAARVQAAGQHEVYLIELAPARDPADVLSLLAASLGLAHGVPEALLRAASGVLGERRALFVLDNCEHMLDACASLTRELLSRCPRLKVLATSREPLDLPGEQRFPIAGLAFPDLPRPSAPDELRAFAAVQLFLDRAHQRVPSLVIDETSLLAIGEICRRLDGLPLAIELAAARTAARSPREIAERLSDRLTLLGQGGRGLPERQQTLRGTLDWSYQLLPEDERRLLELLSIFPSSFTLEAAAAVHGGATAGSTLELLERLIVRSLVVVTPGDRSRYRLLETVQLYAAEKLAENGDPGGARERHARYFIGLVRRAACALTGAAQAETHQQLEREQENLRAALHDACEREDAELALELTGLLGRHWLVRGFTSEGRQWAERALAIGQEAPPLLRARALLTLASLLNREGDIQDAEKQARHALSLARDARAVAVAADVVFLLANILSKRDAAAALVAFEDAVRLCARAGDQRGIASAQVGAGLVLFPLGRRREAATAIEGAIPVLRSISDLDGVGVCLSCLARFAAVEGDHARSEELTRVSLRLVWATGNRHVAASNLLSLAALTARRGLTEEGAMLFAAAEQLFATIHSVPNPLLKRATEPLRRRAAEQLGEAAFSLACQRGGALLPSEAVDLALSLDMPHAGGAVAGLEQPGAAVRSARRPRLALSPREEEVLTLVASGRSNREIAGALTLSIRTVERHLATIYSKLGIHSRVQAATHPSGAPLAVQEHT